MATTCSKSPATEPASTKITSFFKRVDGPLPIRWTPSAEPPKKKPKREPGRPPKKPSAPMVYITDSDTDRELDDIENEAHAFTVSGANRATCTDGPTIVEITLIRIREAVLEIQLQ